MVHALLECRRTLKPDGILIDLRPLVSNPAIEIITGDQIYLPGAINDQAGKPDDEAANSAVAEVVSRGCFSLETQHTFPFNLYFNHLEEMVRYIEEKWNDFAFIPAPVLERAREITAALQTSCRVRIQEPMQLKVYKKRPLP